jgi:hypothetical protein
MTTIISSPLTKAKEVEIVYERILRCESIDEMRYASELVDFIEDSQPEEREIIKDMRNLVCDLTFQFYFERYPISEN